jgi:hypothetical protein
MPFSWSRPSFLSLFTRVSSRFAIFFFMRASVESGSPGLMVLKVQSGLSSSRLKRF